MRALQRSPIAASIRRFTTRDKTGRRKTSSRRRPAGYPASRASEQLSAPATGRARGDVVVIRLLGDQRLGRQDQGGDGSSVADSTVADLYRIDDAGFDHVDRLSAARVKAVAISGFCNLGDRGCAIAAAIGDDAGERVAQ